MNVRAWLERVDPGTHRRIKGLRLVTAYGIAWMMGTLEGRSIQLPGHDSLSALAAGFALWASVSEGRTTRVERVLRRIVGTAIGVPLGLACLPFALHLPFLICIAAAVAMVVYAMALPERYDIACGAYAFALIVTMAVQGESSVIMLVSRPWETLIGGALGLATAMLIFPLRARQPR